MDNQRTSEVEQFTRLQKQVTDLKMKEAILRSKIEEQKKLTDLLLQEGKSIHNLTSETLPDMIEEVKQQISKKLEDLQERVTICETFYAGVLK